MHMYVYVHKTLCKRHSIEIHSLFVTQVAARWTLGILHSPRSDFAFHSDSDCKAFDLISNQKSKPSEVSFCERFDYPTQIPSSSVIRSNSFVKIVIFSLSCVFLISVNFINTRTDQRQNLY